MGGEGDGEEEEEALEEEEEVVVVVGEEWVVIGISPGEGIRDREDALRMTI